VDNLYVKQALANEGPRMKRIRPAPMGRAYRYQRRLTHIILTVAERPGKADLVTKAAKTPKGKAAARPKKAAAKKKATSRA
jgi:large subunit ribosomal protein L22